MTEIRLTFDTILVMKTNVFFSDEIGHILNLKSEHQVEDFEFDTITLY